MLENLTKFSYPYPIAEIWQTLESAGYAGDMPRKYNRIIDLYDCILKSLNFYLLGLAFHNRRLSPNLKKKLEDTLKNPVYSNWTDLLATLLENLATFKEPLVDSIRLFYYSPDPNLARVREGVYFLIQDTTSVKKVKDITVARFFEDFGRYVSQTKMESGKSYLKPVEVLVPVFKEILERLEFLKDYAIGYVPLIQLEGYQYDHTLDIYQGLIPKRVRYLNQEPLPERNRKAYLFRVTREGYTPMFCLHPFMAVHQCRTHGKEEIYYLRYQYSDEMDYYCFQCHEKFRPETLLIDFQDVMDRFIETGISEVSDQIIEAYKELLQVAWKEHVLTDEERSKIEFFKEHFKIPDKLARNLEDNVLRELGVKIPSIDPRVVRKYEEMVKHSIIKARITTRMREFLEGYRLQWGIPLEYSRKMESRIWYEEGLKFYEQDNLISAHTCFFNSSLLDESNQLAKEKVDQLSGDRQEIIRHKKTAPPKEQSTIIVEPPRPLSPREETIAPPHIIVGGSGEIHKRSKESIVKEPLVKVTEPIYRSTGRSKKILKAAPRQTTQVEERYEQQYEEPYEEYNETIPQDEEVLYDQDYQEGQVEEYDDAQADQYYEEEYYQQKPLKDDEYYEYPRGHVEYTAEEEGTYYEEEGYYDESPVESEEGQYEEDYLPAEDAQPLMEEEEYYEETSSAEEVACEEETLMDEIVNEEMDLPEEHAQYPVVETEAEEELEYLGAPEDGTVEVEAEPAHYYEEKVRDEKVQESSGLLEDEDENDTDREIIEELTRDVPDEEIRELLGDEYSEEEEEEPSKKAAEEKTATVEVEAVEKADESKASEKPAEIEDKTEEIQVEKPEAIAPSSEKIPELPEEEKAAPKGIPVENKPVEEVREEPEIKDRKKKKTKLSRKKKKELEREKAAQKAEKSSAVAVAAPTVRKVEKKEPEPDTVKTEELEKIKEEVPETKPEAEQEKVEVKSEAEAVKEEKVPDVAEAEAVDEKAGEESASGELDDSDLMGPILTEEERASGEISILEILPSIKVPSIEEEIADKMEEVVVDDWHDEKEELIISGDEDEGFFDVEVPSVPINKQLGAMVSETLEIEEEELEDEGEEEEEEEEEEETAPEVDDDKTIDLTRSKLSLAEEEKDERGRPRKSIGQLLADAKGSLQDEDYDRAHEICNSILKIDPNNMVAKLLRGKCAIENEEYELAYDDLTEVKGIKSEDPTLLLLHGKASLEVGYFEEALEDLDIVIKKIPGNAEAYLMRGIVYLELEKYKEAIAELRTAVRMNPDDPEIYLNRGNVFIEIREYEKAIEDYNRAIELDPEDPYFYFQRGNGYFLMKEYQLAMQDFNSAIELDPEDMDFYVNRGITYKQMKQMDMALKDFTSVIQDGEDISMALTQRGSLFLQLGRKMEALNDFTFLIEEEPDAPVGYTLRGTVQMELNDWKKALEDLDKALSKDPEYINALINKAGVLLELKHYDDAIGLLTQVIKINPYIGEAYLNRGIAREKLGKADEAKKDFGRYLQLNRIDRN